MSFIKLTNKMCIFHFIFLSSVHVVCSTTSMISIHNCQIRFWFSLSQTFHARAGHIQIFSAKHFMLEQGTYKYFRSAKHFMLELGTYKYFRSAKHSMLELGTYKYFRSAKHFMLELGTYKYFRQIWCIRIFAKEI